jgi:hypothetical protein
MQKIKIYQIALWDGGDRHNASDVCFWERVDAEYYLKAGGHRHDIINTCAFTVYNNVDDYAAVHSQEVRDTALAKLTDIEKGALGLS